MLYNFGAAVGDSWVVTVEDPTVVSPCDDTSRVIVTDTGRVTINSTSYRYITIDPFSNATVGMKGTYVKRFGSIDTD